MQTITAQYTQSVIQGWDKKESWVRIANEIYVGVTNGRVLTVERYTHRHQKLQYFFSLISIWVGLCIAIVNDTKKKEMNADYAVDKDVLLQMAGTTLNANLSPYPFRSNESLRTLLILPDGLHKLNIANLSMVVQRVPKQHYRWKSSRPTCH